MRRCSVDAGPRRPDSLSAVSAAARPAARSVACTPSRRNNAPRSVSLRSRAALTIRSFSAPLHFRFFAGLMPSMVRDSRSHRERSGWCTPTSLASALALTAAGPINRRSIRLLNAGLYSAMRLPTFDPQDCDRVTALSYRGRATTILTPGAPSRAPAVGIGRIPCIPICCAIPRSRARTTSGRWTSRISRWRTASAAMRNFGAHRFSRDARLLHEYGGHIAGAAIFCPMFYWKVATELG
jgi:hypothetical protein